MLGVKCQRVAGRVGQVHRTLQLCEILCAKLAFVGTARLGKRLGHGWLGM